MAVVEGLKVDVPGKELSGIARRVADLCDRRATDIEGQARRHAKSKGHSGERATSPEKERRDDVAGKPFTTGALGQAPWFAFPETPKPSDTKGQAFDCGYLVAARQFSAELRARAEWLRFMADHWNAKTTYRLTPAEYGEVSGVPYAQFNIPEEGP